VPEKIYLDTCALNRLSDTPTQPRVRSETEAVVRILEIVATGNLRWIASTVLQYEVSQGIDIIRRTGALQVLTGAAEIVDPSPSAIATAQSFQAAGLSFMDALHLAVSQQAGADWLLTTDDRFLKAGNRLRQNQAPELVNPVNWLQRRHLWLLQPPSSNPA
jgi:predicted nucleic acid-binding protein